MRYAQAKMLNAQFAVQFAVQFAHGLAVPALKWHEKKENK